MCAVSMIGDHYNDKWQQRDWYNNLPYLPRPAPQISRSEFDDLKKEVLEMKELLKRAKKYDEENNEPDCEIDAKMEILRKVASLVGVNLDDVIANKGQLSA